MPIYALGDDTPEIHPDAFVHPDAVVIGAVRIGAESTIWPNAVLRGDGGGRIEIGAQHLGAGLLGPAHHARAPDRRR